MARRRYFKQLRIAQFRAIIELADKKGFAAAAASLELSTPSVWQQIRSLEDEFNVPLLSVSGQTVSLTSHGELLVDLATPVVEGFDSLVEQFSNRAEKIQKRLSVASPANILVNELPSPIHEYHKKHKNVELSLIDLPSNPARKLLEDGEVVEDAPHAELLRTGGLYARFWARQSGGFIGLEEEAAE